MLKRIIKENKYDEEWEKCFTDAYIALVTCTRCDSEEIQILAFSTLKELARA